LIIGIHSIEYSGLENYFYLFGALKDGKEWSSWDEIVKMSEEYGIPHGFEILIYFFKFQFCLKENLQN
jgi:hypothetical protein